MLVAGLMTPASWVDLIVYDETLANLQAFQRLVSWVCTVSLMRLDLSSYDYWTGSDVDQVWARGLSQRTSAV